MSMLLTWGPRFENNLDVTKSECDQVRMLLLLFNHF